MGPIIANGAVLPGEAVGVATREKGIGTGMGASITHGIAKRLNSHIEVQSIPGEGTEFKVHLPVDSSAVRTPPHPLPVGKSSPHPTERILIVDDETAILNLLKTYLEKIGYKVMPETDPTAALGMFHESPGNFDLVITDMTMPKMTGEELASEILSIRPDIPIIMFTGYSENFTLEMALTMGIRDFIRKPVSTKKLADRIRSILDTVPKW
ncbi:MAG: response regulator [Desulfobacterales bacterium]|nr:response regulator [Desulfobacterales bacterium]